MNKLHEKFTRDSSQETLGLTAGEALGVTKLKEKKQISHQPGKLSQPHQPHFQWDYHQNLHLTLSQAVTTAFI